MEENFFKAIREFDMLSAGDTVLVGVSGGADSMCLLDLLNKRKEELNISVYAAHVNHCLRGEESDADERFVRAFCEEKNIPLSVLRADINDLRKQSGESTELCARKVRYDFFASLGCTKIATAHTASDAEETMLMNLSRGASLNGLCSIPAVRGNVIRPLLYFLREDTEKYCNDHGIPFVVDSTNLTDDYTRNKFRHNVIGVLKDINPSFEENAKRCLESLRTDNDFLEKYADNVLLSLIRDDASLDGCALTGYHKAIRYRVIAAYFRQFSDADFEKRHIEQADENLLAESFVELLPGNNRLNIRNGKMYFESEHKNYVFEKILADKNEKTVFSWNGKKISLFPSEPRELFRDEIAVDFYGINDIITIRPRKEGDTLSLLTRHCTKSLKKLFNEMKIPVSLRGSVPVAADDDGVIWCAVGGADARRKITTETKKFFIIKTEDCKND